MYCDEVIKRVWVLESMVEKPDRWEYADYFHGMDCYVSDGTWKVFQTESHFITVGFDRHTNREAARY